MGGDIVSEETRKDVITLSHVGMEFHLNKEKVDSLKEYFIKLVKHDIAYTEFWALKDVTFSVKQGDRVGILGCLDIRANSWKKNSMRAWSSPSLASL